MELIKQLESLLRKIVQMQPGCETEITFRLKEGGELGRYPTVRHIRRDSKKDKTIHETVTAL